MVNAGEPLGSGSRGQRDRGRMNLTEASLREDALLADQREVFDYWSSLKNGRDLPLRTDFKPAKIVRRLPTISLVDVAFDFSRFRFRLVGTGLREIFGEEVTGRYLDQIPYGVQHDHWHDIYRRVARSGQPAQGYTPLLWRDRPSVVQAWLRLPFADEAGVVNVILGYDRFLPIERLSSRAAEQARAAASAEPQFATAGVV